MVDSEKFKINSIQSIKKEMETTWSGYASEELCSSLGITIQSIAKIKLQLNNFDGALALLEKYKEKKAEIDVYKGAIEDERANPSLLSTEEYLENGKKKTVTVFVVNQKLIDEYNGKIIILKEEKLAIKTKIETILASITGVELSNASPNGYTIPAGELSYEDALELSIKLCVPVDYIIGLHLHEGYQLGDRLIPEGINPDVIHYAGPNGYPILIDGIKDLGDGYDISAEERGKGNWFRKKAENYSVVGAGREYDIKGWPITFGELEINYNYNGKVGDVYWTWYGPKSQANILNQEDGSIRCTPDFYPCDDGFYRDKDGYIVLAGNPYINQFDEITGKIDFSKNGGLEYEEVFIVTPFGLGRFYDNTEQTVPNGISADLYRNDGHESNTVAQTEAGKRLRETAVADYESLGLYWNDMIH